MRKKSSGRRAVYVTEEMVGQLYGDTRSMMALQAVVYEYMKERIEIQYQESETTGDVTG